MHPIRKLLFILLLLFTLASVGGIIAWKCIPPIQQLPLLQAWGIVPNIEPIKLILLPSMMFRTARNIHDADLATVGVITGPNCSLERRVYRAHIRNKAEFIQFCSTHNVVNRDGMGMMMIIWLDTTRRDEMAERARKPIDWDFVWSKTKVTNHWFGTSYSVNFDAIGYGINQVTIFSNGIVFSEACEGK